jgi:CDP-diacylglycerol--glycerol-3-phosphate 3-phosphatidyltransferase
VWPTKIDCIRQALRKKPYLKVLLLADALRSTREGAFQEVDGKVNGSGASLLAALVRDFPHQVDVRLYRTPGLPVWLEKVIGKRLVEGAGLQHMKIYGGDDEVIISG